MRVNPEQIECSAIDEEFDFEKMLNESETDFEGGKIQEGVIVSIGNEFAMVAIAGAKQEGRLSIAEISDEKGNLLFKQGDKIEVFVTLNNERSSISHKKVLKMKKLEQKINELKGNFENQVVECKIIKKNRGGFVVEFDGVEAFLPRKESALREDGKSVGKTFKMCIMDVKPQENSIVVSRKKFLDTVEKNKEEIISKIMAESGNLAGIVRKITPFGIFVDVMGVEGLVHYTQISHKGPVNPATVCKVGDSVEVKVIEYVKEKNRLSFSIKATIEDPWNEIKSQLDVGDTIRVTVSKLEDYGAFVDLGNGTEGFLHISEISWNKQIKHPKEVLNCGEAIDVEVIEIDATNKRLRVSLKRLTPKPFAQFLQTHRVGDVVEGEVVKVLDFGAFVNLGVVDGLLHNEDFSWERGEKASTSLKAGDKVKVKIIKIDKDNEKISLSIKALQESPIDQFSKTHAVDSIVSGAVIDVKDFGVFIELEGGIEALIRDEDLYPLKKEEIQKGDKIEGVIAHIDRNHGKVRVSVRRLERIKEREQLNQYNNTDTKMTLGDLIKQRNGQ